MNRLKIVSSLLKGQSRGKTHVTLIHGQWEVLRSINHLWCNIVDMAPFMGIKGSFCSTENTTIHYFTNDYSLLKTFSGTLCSNFAIICEKILLNHTEWTINKWAEVKQVSKIMNKWLKHQTSGTLRGIVNKLTFAFINVYMYLRGETTGFFRTSQTRLGRTRENILGQIKQVKTQLHLFTRLWKKECMTKIKFRMSYFGGNNNKFNAHFIWKFQSATE